MIIFQILLLIKMSKVAVVTGSNKGIGLATVQGLLPKFEGDVYLTARNDERGLAAIELLKKVNFFRMNVLNAWHRNNQSF